MADNFDNYGMKVQATASVKMPTASEIDKQIRNLEKSISKLQISGKLDDSSLKNLSHQLDTLKATVTTANFSPTALSELTNQVNRALQNINIGNINVGNAGNQAQQVGQQIGNNIGQQITQSISSAIQKGTMTMKNADGTTKDLSKYIPSGKLLQNDVAKEALKDFQALGVGIVTVKEEMKNIDGKNLLNGFTINIKNAKGEVESLRYALTDIEGKTGKMFQYVGGSINDNGIIQQMNTISAKADSLQTKLDKMKASYSDLNASRPIKDSGNISALSQQYDKVTKAIENVRNADSASFSSMISNAQREIAVLENMVSQFRNAENVATQMKSVDISSGIAQAQERLGKLKANASGFDQMKQTIVNLDNAIAKVGDKSSLDNFINQLKTAETQLSRVKAETRNMATEQQRLSLANTIEAWNQKNTAATKEVRAENDRYVASLRDLNNQMTKIDFNKINNGFKQNENSMRTLHKLGASLKDQLKQAASSFTQWVSVSSAIMAVIYQLQKMPQKVKELDDAITDFTMATGSNKAQISELTKVYSKLGDELSATVTDVTISATEWLKQGKSIAETETLIRDAMVLSKVGKLSSEESTKYLTSAMKGYNVTAEETLAIVDKLSAVDMASATDVGGLAEGMSEVANNANLAGISMDKLLGYLATIGEVTQSSMSEVGTSLNAIFSRMGNIKLSRLKDYQNNGEDLSNVETVLRGEGIALRDSADDFRNFGEVLDEVAGRWNSFSEVSQRAIASAFAGTNHMEDFLVLMSNYDTALGYTETSLNSSGQAMEKFEAYEESLTGKLEKLENAFIKLSNTVLDSGLLKGLVDLGTTGVKAIDGLVNALTPLGTIGLLGGAGLGIKNAG